MDINIISEKFVTSADTLRNARNKGMVQTQTTKMDTQSVYFYIGYAYFCLHAITNSELAKKTRLKGKTQMR